MGVSTSVSPAPEHESVLEERHADKQHDVVAPSSISQTQLAVSFVQLWNDAIALVLIHHKKAPESTENMCLQKVCSLLKKGLMDMAVLESYRRSELRHLACLPAVLLSRHCELCSGFGKHLASLLRT